jgi:7,8-dihydropterin-6-yl-methyl-4-(beta-D-ribofuranosyl)aminobenzene 5'-phosphate synthase
MTPLRITSLVENDAARPSLRTEHGLSFWVEWGGRRILFDTGQGLTLLENAREMEVPLTEVETVVLSHGHWDHASGLKPLLDAGMKPEVLLHPDALKTRYSKWHKPPEEPIGMPPPVEDALRTKTRRLIWTTAPTPLTDGAWVTGPIPRRTEFEDVGGPFYLDRAFTQPDPITDDQAVWFETVRGVVVLLGCAHAGVVNTLAYVSELAGKPQIHAVLGGMHLLRAKRPRMEATLQALRRHQVEFVAPAHCTGERATAFLAQQLPGNCIPCKAGSQFEF